MCVKLLLLLFFATISENYFVFQHPEQTDINRFALNSSSILWLRFWNCPRCMSSFHTRLFRTIASSKRVWGDMIATKTKPNITGSKKKSFIFHAMELNFVVVIIKTDHVHDGLLSFASCNFWNENISHSAIHTNHSNVSPFFIFTQWNSMLYESLESLQMHLVFFYFLL